MGVQRAVIIINDEDIKMTMVDLPPLIRRQTFMARDEFKLSTPRLFPSAHQTDKVGRKRLADLANHRIAGACELVFLVIVLHKAVDQAHGAMAMLKVECFNIKCLSVFIGFQFREKALKCRKLPIVIDDKFRYKLIASLHAPAIGCCLSDAVF